MARRGRKREMHERKRSGEGKRAAAANEKERAGDGPGMIDRGYKSGIR